MVNISEEYTIRNEGLIILISGLSGSNRGILAKEIERDFKIKLITLEDYCEKENAKTFVINSDLKVTDLEHIESNINYNTLYFLFIYARHIRSNRIS